MDQLRYVTSPGADRGSDGGGYVDLSGVIFIRATTPPKGKPLDPEYDELNLGIF